MEAASASSTYLLLNSSIIWLFVPNTVPGVETPEHNVNASATPQLFFC